MKVLFLLKYGDLGASTRYRVYQYLPFLQQAGVTYRIHTLFSNNYLQNQFSSKHLRLSQLKQSWAIGSALTRRYFTLVNELEKYDVIYVHCEALPFIPFAIEKKLFAARNKVVLDFDDAIYVTYEQHPNWFIRKTLGNKISELVKHSQYITTGNQHLEDWAKQFNKNVTVIPTSVDINLYKSESSVLATQSQPIIGWIGTPITANYLNILKQPMQILRTQLDFRLKIIGAPQFSMDSIDVEAKPWTQVDEINDLKTCTIGVMPLPDEAWARGKSALKLIQYLAAGTAAVASPVGANCDVVQDGVNGFLASTTDEWVEKLKLLLENSELRQKFAKIGQQTVENDYSIQSNAPKFIDVLYKVACQN